MRTVTCPNKHKMPAYAMRCLHCGKPLREVGSLDGQLALVSLLKGSPICLALVYEGKEVAVADDPPPRPDENGSDVEICISTGDSEGMPITLDLKDVIRALQRREESVAVSRREGFANVA